jgi:hypothetical protein
VTITFRPAIRLDTPLIIGLAGPTKSGKTYSAHRLARGLCAGKPIVMINAEGARGHQYADTFKYLAHDITAPFRPEKYEEAVNAVAGVGAGCLIIDSASHMHDGPGGILEWHDDEQKRIAGRKEYGSEREREKAEDRATMTAWIEPKKAENQFIYAMLALEIPIVLCFRAKEKLKLVTGKAPIELGWQPIASDRVAFETLFTLTLPPHCKGVPDLSISDMREPFDTMVPEGKQIDEALGERLAEWAKGLKVVVTESVLRDCKTLDELQAAWVKLSPVDKQRFTAAKDETKVRLRDAEIEKMKGTTNAA